VTLHLGDHGPLLPGSQACATGTSSPRTSCCATARRCDPPPGGGVRRLVWEGVQTPEVVGGGWSTPLPPLGFFSYDKQGTGRIGGSQTPSPIPLLHIQALVVPQDGPRTPSHRVWSVICLWNGPPPSGRIPPFPPQRSPGVPGPNSPLNHLITDLWQGYGPSIPPSLNPQSVASCAVL